MFNFYFHLNNSFTKVFIKEGDPIGGTHEKGRGGMGIFCNNFWELGDPNQKSFFGRGGIYFYFLGVSAGDPVFLERVG